MSHQSGKILIKNGLVVRESGSIQADILIVGSTIAAIAPDLDAPTDAEVVDASGCIVTLGLADVHVHFREPGGSAKETIRTGSLAAAHGGYTVVCTMPNLNPAPDALETLAVEQKLIDEQAVIDVRPFATITRGRSGSEVVDMAAMKDSVAGFSDDGSGVQGDSVMLEAMKKACAADVIISAHCEDMTQAPFSPESEYLQIERDVQMAAATGCRYHVCHVSTARSVEAIRQAKKAGASVSCETAPHYLTLCQDDRTDEGRFRMNPPLRSAQDCVAMIEGIIDGTVEVIATDHAPHTAEEKSRGYDKSLMGIVGLETAFPVLYTSLVLTGYISIEKLIALMSWNPRRIFRLGGQLEVGEKADIAVFDVNESYTIDSREFLSMGRSTPFEGWHVQGRCILTLKDGQPVWADERFA